METQSMHPKRVPVLGRAAALVVAALLGTVGCNTEGFDSSWPEARPLGRTPVIHIQVQAFTVTSLSIACCEIKLNFTWQMIKLSMRIRTELIYS